MKNKLNCTPFDYSESVFAKKARKPRPEMVGKTLIMVPTYVVVDTADDVDEDLACLIEMGWSLRVTEKTKRRDMDSALGLPTNQDGLDLAVEAWNGLGFKDG